MTKKMGPNDAVRIVWAISMCFFFKFLCFFSTLIHIHDYYRYYSDRDGLTGDYDEENGPKQHETCHLGH